MIAEKLVSEQTIVIDPEFRDYLSALRPEEYKTLESNILESSCETPLILWGDVLIDGHNRYRICTEHNLPFETENKAFSSREAVIDWMLVNQLGRRNLSPDDFRLFVGRLYNSRKKSKSEAGSIGGSSNPQIEGSLPTAEIIATEHGTSRATVERAGKQAEAIDTQATPELKEAVRKHEVPVSVAAEVATLPPEQQTEIVAKGEKEILAAAKEIRSKKTEVRRVERSEKINEIAKGEAPLDSLEQKYPLIYCDPPWRYDHAKSDDRAIENQYPTMSIDEICAMPIGDAAAGDCVMFMWTTSPKLLESFKVLASWGFEYKTCAVWDKKKIGMGYYFRQQHELLLIAVKGSVPVPPPAARVSSVISFARGEHSSKPHEVYEVIEAMYPELDKLEMFCRTPREGWGSWGNQA